MFICRQSSFDYAFAIDIEHLISFFQFTFATWIVDPGELLIRAEIVQQIKVLERLIIDPKFLCGNVLIPIVGDPIAINAVLLLLFR